MSNSRTEYISQQGLGTGVQVLDEYFFPIPPEPPEGGTGPHIQRIPASEKQDLSKWWMENRYSIDLPKYEALLEAKHRRYRREHPDAPPINTKPDGALFTNPHVSWEEDSTPTRTHMRSGPYLSRHDHMGAYQELAHQAAQEATYDDIYKESQFRPMSFDLWWKLEKEKHNRTKGEKALAFGGSAAGAGWDVGTNLAKAGTEVLFFSPLQAGWWKNLAEGGYTGFSDFDHMLGSIEGSWGLDIEKEDDARQLYENYNEAQWYQKRRHEGFIFDRVESQYGSVFNINNPQGPVHTDKDGNLVHGPVREATSYFVDPTLLAPVPLGGPAKAVARKTMKGGIWVVEKGARYTQKGIDKMANGKNAALAKLGIGLQTEAGRRTAAAAGGTYLAYEGTQYLLGDDFKVPPWVLASAAVVSGGVAPKLATIQTVSKVFSTPSGQKRFLARLLDDPAMSQSPRLRRLAFLAYKRNSTEYGDLAFSMLVDGATVASVNSALAYAAGGGAEEVGAAAGSGMTIGTGFGALAPTPGAGKSTAALGRDGNLGPRTRVDAGGTDIEGTAKATYDALINPATGENVARTQVEQGLTPVQQLSLTNRSDTDIDIYLREKFAAQSKEQFELLPPAAQAMYLTMAASFGGSAPQFHIFDNAAQMAGFLSRLHGVEYSASGMAQGMYDKGTRTIFLHRGSRSPEVIARAFAHETAHATIGTLLDRALDDSASPSLLERRLWDDITESIAPAAGETGKKFYIYSDLLDSAGQPMRRKNEDGTDQFILVGERAAKFADTYNLASGGTRQADAIFDADGKPIPGATTVVGGRMRDDARSLVHELLAENAALMFLKEPNAFNHMSIGSRTTLRGIFRGTLAKMGVLDAHGAPIKSRKHKKEQGVPDEQLTRHIDFAGGRNLSDLLFAYREDPIIRHAIRNYMHLRDLAQKDAMLLGGDGVPYQAGPGQSSAQVFTAVTGGTGITRDMNAVLRQMPKKGLRDSHAANKQAGIGPGDTVDAKVRMPDGTMVLERRRVKEITGSGRNRRVIMEDINAPLEVSSIQSGDSVTVIRNEQAVVTGVGIEGRGGTITDTSGTPIDIRSGDRVHVIRDGRVLHTIDSVARVEDGRVHAEEPTADTEAPQGHRMQDVTRVGNPIVVMPGKSGQRFSEGFYQALRTRGEAGRQVESVVRDVERALANGYMLKFGYSSRSYNKGNNPFLVYTAVPFQLYLSKQGRASVYSWNMDAVDSNINLLREGGIIDHAQARRIKERMEEISTTISARMRDVDLSDPSVNLMDVFKIDDPLISAVMGAKVENISDKSPQLGEFIEGLKESGAGWADVTGMSGKDSKGNNIRRSTIQQFNFDTMNGIQVVPTQHPARNLRYPNVRDAHLPEQGGAQQLPPDLLGGNFRLKDGGEEFELMPHKHPRYERMQKARAQTFHIGHGDLETTLNIAEGVGPNGATYTILTGGSAATRADGPGGVPDQLTRELVIELGKEFEGIEFADDFSDPSAQLAREIMNDPSWPTPKAMTVSGDLPYFATKGANAYKVAQVAKRVLQKHIEGDTLDTYRHTSTYGSRFAEKPIDDEVMSEAYKSKRASAKGELSAHISTLLHMSQHYAGYPRTKASFEEGLHRVLNRDEMRVANYIDLPAPKKGDVDAAIEFLHNHLEEVEVRRIAGAMRKMDDSALENFEKLPDGRLHDEGYFNEYELDNYRREVLGDLYDPGNYQLPPGETAPAFYSQVERVVQSDKIPRRAPPQDILGILRKQPGVKEQEIRWLDLEGFMSGKKSVTKEELLEHIQLNRLEVEVVELGPVGDLVKRVNQIFNNFSRTPESASWVGPYNETADLLGRVTMESYIGGDNPQSAIRYMTELHDSLGDHPEVQAELHKTLNDVQLAGGAAKYEEHNLTTPGYKPGTYRELLFRVPSTPRPATITEADGAFIVSFKERDGTNNVYTGIKTKAEAEAIVREKAQFSDESYTQGHYGSTASNVFAHTRVAEFEVDGKRVLHATELQSDWHKDYRGRSFGPKPPLQGTWHQFALKALVRHAAENGFDEVAWVTGKETQARYDLSRKVDELMYRKHPTTGEWKIDVYEKGDTTGESFTTIHAKDANELESNFGKEIADKIISGQGEEVNLTRFKSLKTEDLKVGGEWAVNLYDKTLPNVAKKTFKKFPGANVRRGKLTDVTQGSRLADRLEALDLEEVAGDLDISSIDRVLTDEEIGMLPEEFENAYGELDNWISRDDFNQAVFDLRRASRESADAWFLTITPEMKQSVLGEGQAQWLPADADYRMTHTAPDAEFGAPLHDVTGNIYPDDIYGPNGARYYGDGSPLDNESHRIISQMRGKPDAMVTVYRAVPKDVDVINPGDWVTINKGYAEMHGEGTLQGDYHIIEKQVPAKDIFTEGNSLHEWGWSPGATQQLPPGPIENAKREFSSASRNATREEEVFFRQIWPMMLRRVGGQVKPGTRGYRLAAKRAIGDIEDWLRNNPKFADYYNKDWKLTRAHLNSHFGKITEDEFALYRLAAGLTSPATKLPSNIGDAVKVLDLYKREGNLDSIKMGLSPKGNVVIESSPISISGTTASGKARTLKIVDKLAQDKGGVVKALEFLQEPVTIQELNQFNKDMGYKGRVAGIGPIRELVKQATGQDERIPRMFIFGKKVGAYTLNAVGDARYNTVDVWESRFIRSYFHNMFDENTGLPANIQESTIFHEFSKAFKVEFEKETGQTWDTSALQAIRWFYMIDAAKQAGYSGASTNETISGYTSKALQKLRAGYSSSRGQGTKGNRQEVRTQTSQEVKQLPASRSAAPPAMRPGAARPPAARPPSTYPELVRPVPVDAKPGPIYTPVQGGEEIDIDLLRRLGQRN